MCDAAGPRFASSSPFIGPPSAHRSPSARAPSLRSSCALPTHPAPRCPSVARVRTRCPALTRGPFPPALAPHPCTNMKCIETSATCCTPGGAKVAASAPKLRPAPYRGHDVAGGDVAAAAWDGGVVAAAATASAAATAAAAGGGGGAAAAAGRGARRSGRADGGGRHARRADPHTRPARVRRPRVPRRTVHDARDRRPCRRGRAWSARSPTGAGTRAKAHADTDHAIRPSATCRARTVRSGCKRTTFIHTAPRPARRCYRAGTHTTSASTAT